MVGLTHDKRWVDAHAVLVDVASNNDTHTLTSPNDLLVDFPTEVPDLGAAPRHQTASSSPSCTALSARTA